VSLFSSLREKIRSLGWMLAFCSYLDQSLQISHLTTVLILDVLFPWMRETFLHTALCFQSKKRVIFGNAPFLEHWRLAPNFAIFGKMLIGDL
jgi:hypothetical protein